MIPQLLSAGDIAPDCILAGADGKELNLRSDSIAGNPLVILFCPRLSAAGKELLDCFSRRVDSFTANGGRLFAVTLDKPEAVAPQSFNFPVFVDRRQQAFANFTAPRDRPSTVVLRRNHHVAGILNGHPEAQAAAAIGATGRDGVGA